MLRLALLALLIGLVAVPVAARLWLHWTASDRVHANVAGVPVHRVALVLGTQVYASGRLSPRLASRCNKAIELYKAGRVEKLLMSGDGRRVSNREPESMCDYAVRHGVPVDDITIDDQGFRTYDSIYRAKHVFGLRRFIIVTQGFHLDRSLYLCSAIGVEADGVPAAMPGEIGDRVREPMACVLAIVDTHFRQPHPVLGPKRPI